MTIKKNDFVEIEYTGKTKDENFVFDTTEEKTAKASGIHNPEAKYGPAIICVGQQHVLAGIDKHLEGKGLGEFTLTLRPEEAFGKKNAKLIQLIPTTKFHQQKIQPQPGLQVNIDGHIGVVKTVTGGRTLVDFNHPLSGKEVIYTIKIKRMVTDKKEQLNAVLKMRLGIHDANIELQDNKAKITIKQDLPKEIQEHLAKEIKEQIPLQTIEWVKQK